MNAMENHLAVNTIPPDLLIFAYCNKDGDHICLSRRKFLLRCNEIWSRHGIPSTTGHSFRIRGTTHLLIAGVNPEVVQAMGRWKSDVFLVYWCRLDILAPLHAEFVNL
jgi:site-specific recombinase XerD